MAKIGRVFAMDGMGHKSYEYCCLWTNLGNIDGLVDWLVAPVVTHEF